MKRKIFLVDGNSFCYRAFYAIRELSTSKGEPTNAIYGVLSMLRKILKEEKPDGLAVCFDRGEPTFRQLVGRARATALDAYAHQDAPFERVVEAVGQPRDTSRSPLFQVSLVLPNLPESKVRSAGLVFEAIARDVTTATFDLTSLTGGLPAVRMDTDDATAPIAPGVLATIMSARLLLSFCSARARTALSSRAKPTTTLRPLFRPAHFRISAVGFRRMIVADEDFFSFTLLRRAGV